MAEVSVKQLEATLEGGYVTQTKERTFAYELYYRTEDVVFSEPFVVMEAINYGRPAWWESRGKVDQLIAALKIDLTNAQACVQAGITLDQYRDFCKVHPTFSMVKARCKSLPSVIAKQRLVGALKDTKYGNFQVVF